MSAVPGCMNSYWRRKGAAEVVPHADVVILTIPDSLIGAVTHQQEPHFKPGAILMALDAAAPFAGELRELADLTMFVAQPRHPPMFNEETELDGRPDHRS